jgi:hypothetical protein
MENWVICPTIDLPEMTITAARDILGQVDVQTRVLLISNGSSDESRAKFEAFAEACHPRVLLWSHDPPLPSLSWTWNRALQFCWEAGAEEALVLNNDVRLHPQTYSLLLQAQAKHGALLTSAVNTGEMPEPYKWDLDSRGGPDFSCFLISKECHAKYPFDNNLCWFGDNQIHRTMWLAGDGARIGSVLVPYKHLASQTIKGADEALAAQLHARFRRDRDYYQKAWGGLPHHETYLKAFDPASAREGVGTPGGFLSMEPPK